MGHTMSIHSQDEKVILEFGLKKPAFRIVVNTPTAHGSIGLTTGLDPAMTLGCGGYGGNITSDNISPRHLLNIKRLAYEVRPVTALKDREKRPVEARPAPTGLTARALTERIDAFLGSRGYAGAPERAPALHAPAEATGSPASPGDRPAALDFVCEDDVRQAIRTGRKLLVSERAIITPLARELAEQHGLAMTAIAGPARLSG
jgi:acetaldehyde dehydrogenase (acetylating)